MSEPWREVKWNNESYYHTKEGERDRRWENERMRKCSHQFVSESFYALVNSLAEERYQSGFAEYSLERCRNETTFPFAPSLWSARASLLPHWMNSWEIRLVERVTTAQMTGEGQFPLARWQGWSGDRLWSLEESPLRVESGRIKALQTKICFCLRSEEGRITAFWVF